MKLEAISPNLSKEPLSVREEEAFVATYQRLSSVGGEEEGIQQAPELLKDGATKSSPPPDPFNDEDFPLPPSINEPGFSTSALWMLQSLAGLTNHHTENPLTSLQAAVSSWEGTDFSLPKLMSNKSIIEKLVSKHPHSCRVAVYSLRLLRAGIGKLSRDIDRIDCCLSCGLFSLILQLMRQEKTSAVLQSTGLECFFSLMGGTAIDSSLPLPSTEIRPEPLSESTRFAILAAVVSLVSVPEQKGLKTIVEAIDCVASNYRTLRSHSQKE